MDAKGEFEAEEADTYMCVGGAGLYFARWWRALEIFGEAERCLDIRGSERGGDGSESGEGWKVGRAREWGS